MTTLLGSPREVSLLKTQMSLPREVSLLNLILSFDGQRGRDSRSLIRSKWLARPLDHPGYRHLFVIGGNNVPGYIRQDELWLPSNDTYRGGPSKVIDAFQFVVEHEAEVGTYAYYLKSDDDTLVCIDQLMAWLRLGSLPWTHAYAGQPQTGHWDLRRLRLEDKFDDHNYITIFNRSVYSPYMLGGGYLLSRDTLRHVVSSAGAQGFLEGGRWRKSGLMPYMEDALVGALVGTYAAHYHLPVSASSFADDFKLDIRYPENFCRFLVHPKMLCHHVRGKAWCDEHGPLVIVHPVEIITGNASLMKQLSPAWRMSRHAKLVLNASSPMSATLKQLKKMPSWWFRKPANARLNASRPADRNASRPAGHWGLRRSKQLLARANEASRPHRIGPEVESGLDGSWRRSAAAAAAGPTGRATGRAIDLAA